MSQDQPNSQPPPAPEPGVSQPEATSQEPETQSVQPTDTRSPTFLRAQSIKALRGTIQLLEGVLEKLEAEPPTTARETSSFWNKLQLGWSSALAKIRSLLPENLSAKLSDTALTSIIAVIGAIAFWTTSTLLSGKPTEVAKVPPEISVPTVELTPSPELSTPVEPQPIKVTPPEPVPTLSPTLELTPEQSLIASIQNQVAEITDEYANGLIQSIQPNFRGSSLVITVGDDWYNLNLSQQDKLAAQILERSKELDFSHLEITDPQGILLARSPVVGNNMVILKRQAPTQRG